MPAKRQRNRMIFDLPHEIQLAIRLRALKYNLTTAEVLMRCVEQALPGDLAEARGIIDTRYTGDST